MQCDEVKHVQGSFAQVDTEIGLGRQEKWYLRQRGLRPCLNEGRDGVIKTALRQDHTK